MKMRNTLFFLLPLLLLACTPVPVDVSECVKGEPDGFLMGLWHGIIAPVTFVVSLFTDEVTMYSVNNDGVWYNFGFVIGAGILFGGVHKSRK